jgi:hypothetical protein
LILISAVLLIGGGDPAHGANVYLNELTARPLGFSEDVELYNAGPGSVNVGGWVIRGSKGTFIIPAPEWIPEGGYVSLDVGDIQGERGGVTTLIEISTDKGRFVEIGQDSVHYGQSGSAPLPPAGSSLARAPDAAAGTPPPPSPAGDGLVWTLALPTFGMANIVPAPLMGSSVLLNEFDPLPVGGLDLLELYNPTGMLIDITNWYLINGDSEMLLGGVIPPGQFLVIQTPPGFDLEEVDLLYLFQADNVRVDQLGFHEAPPLGAGECYARCPDGAGPNLGYDYLTSGGGDTFRPVECTLGASNNQACCPPSPAESATWSRLKGMFR